MYAPASHFLKMRTTSFYRNEHTELNEQSPASKLAGLCYNVIRSDYNFWNTRTDGANVELGPNTYW